MEFLCASIDMRICEEGHIHINMQAQDDNDCPMLGIILEPMEAREMACKLLEAAGEVNPVS